MTPEELKRRTKVFAHSCVKLAIALPNGPLANHLRDQLIRCSTSIVANYPAAALAQRKRVFIAKMSIVIEEADESAFWLEFILDEKLMEARKISPLFSEANELSAIPGAARKTAESNQ